MVASRPTCRSCSGRWKMRSIACRKAFFGLFDNFPVRPAALVAASVHFPFGARLSRRRPIVSDIAWRALLMEDSPARDRLTSGMFIDRIPTDPVGRLELALQQVAAAEQIDAKVRASIKSAQASGYTAEERIAAALRAGAITRAGGRAADPLQRAASAPASWWTISRRTSAAMSRPKAAKPRICRKWSCRKIA